MEAAAQVGTALEQPCPKFFRPLASDFNIVKKNYGSNFFIKKKINFSYLGSLLNRIIAANQEK